MTGGDTGIVIIKEDGHVLRPQYYFLDPKWNAKKVGETTWF